MNYVCYQPATGEIVIWGEGQEAAPAPDGCLTIEDADGSCWTHHIVNGALVAYTSEQATAKAAVPDFAAVWSNAAMAWEDQRDIDTARSDTNDMLTAAYVAAIAQNVSFTTGAGDSRMYQSDPVSISNASACMLGCLKAQAVPQGFYWVAADNTRVPFTFADLEGLAAALFVHGFTQFAKLQDLKVAVRAAATVDAVRAITWPAT